MKLLLTQFLSVPMYLVVLGPIIFLSRLLKKITSVYVPLSA
jgi:hypothetical protein